MPSEDTPVVIHELVTLKKYDGDPPAPGEDKEPVETLVLRDGELIEHIIHHQEESHGPD